MIEIVYGPAHTDGDISVTFGEAEILHAADTYWNGIQMKTKFPATASRSC